MAACYFGFDTVSNFLVTYTAIQITRYSGGWRIWFTKSHHHATWQIVTAVALLPQPWFIENEPVSVISGKVTFKKFFPFPVVNNSTSPPWPNTVGITGATKRGDDSGRGHVVRRVLLLLEQVDLERHRAQYRVQDEARAVPGARARARIEQRQHHAAHARVDLRLRDGDRAFAPRDRDLERGERDAVLEKSLVALELIDLPADPRHLGLDLEDLLHLQPARAHQRRQSIERGAEVLDRELLVEQLLRHIRRGDVLRRDLAARGEELHHLLHLLGRQPQLDVRGPRRLGAADVLVDEPPAGPLDLRAQRGDDVLDLLDLERQRAFDHHRLRNLHRARCADGSRDRDRHRPPAIRPRHSTSHREQGEHECDAVHAPNQRPARPPLTWSSRLRS